MRSRSGRHRARERETDAKTEIGEDIFAGAEERVDGRNGRLFVAVLPVSMSVPESSSGKEVVEDDDINGSGDIFMTISMSNSGGDDGSLLNSSTPKTCFRRGSCDASTDGMGYWAFWQRRGRQRRWLFASTAPMAMAAAAVAIDDGGGGD